MPPYVAGTPSRLPPLGSAAMSDEETAKAIKSMTKRSTSAYLNWMAPDLLPEDSDASAPKIEEKNEKKWKPESAVGSVAESAKEDIKAKKAGKSAKSSKTKPKTSKKNAKALKKTVTRSPGRISSFGRHDQGCRAGAVFPQRCVKLAREIGALVVCGNLD